MQRIHIKNISCTKCGSIGLAMRYRGAYCYFECLKCDFYTRFHTKADRASFENIKASKTIGILYEEEKNSKKTVSEFSGGDYGY
jgi:hypothetical protein